MLLDKCRQIIDTESGRVLLYRDEVEEVLKAGDCISRAEAIDALCELCTDKDKCSHNDICPDVEVFNLLPSAQPYTEEQIQKMQDMEQAQLEEAYVRGKIDGIKECTARLKKMKEELKNG